MGAMLKQQRRSVGTRQAAALLGVCREWVVTLCKEGYLPGARRYRDAYGQRVWRVPLKAIRDRLVKHGKPLPDELQKRSRDGGSQ